MSLDHLLHKIRPAVEKHVVQVSEPWPRYTLFASISDGKQRAKVVHCTGSSFDEAWGELTSRVKRLVAENEMEVCWLRVDWVRAVRQARLAQLKDWLKHVKRNYFRHAIALDGNFNIAFLEQELNSNAMLYGGTQYVHAVLNEKNFGVYARKRFDGFQYEFSDENTVYMLDTAGVYCSFEEDPKLLLPKGRDAGRRVIDRLTPDDVYGLIDRSSQYLVSQTLPEGRFYYGWHPCFDRHINTYNTLRHASTTYSMVEAWEVTKAPDLHDAITRSLKYMLADLIKTVTLPDGTRAAFLVEHTGTEVKLGANAVCILAFSKYAELTGTKEYHSVLELLALGIQYMQDTATGQFVHVLNFPDLSVKDKFRIIYYDGEAAFGLMRLYGLTKDPRWLSMVEKAFDHFIEVEHWKAHDHWLSYCVNELTLYREEEKYYRFGLQNVAGYLNFIENRITTFPTLLELIMAAEKMVTRLRDSAQYSHLLEDLDIDKFYFALEKRAHYLLNGHFWPEYAMYFANPQRILGSFFIRHHAFRVRIDDVEHYLSGFVAYLKYLKRGTRTPKSFDAQTELPVLPNPKGPVVAWGGDVNLGRRQHYRTAELGYGNVLMVPALKQADLTIVNLECVVATKGEQGIRKGENGPYYYRARPEMLKILVDTGVDIVATANNHSGDYGPEALVEQAKWLAEVGIASAGSGATREEAFAPTFRLAGDLSVAFFSVDATQHRFSATFEAPGSAYLDLTDAVAWRSEFQPRFEAARKQAHVVLIGVHWGANLKTAPGPAEIAVGRALIDAGADAVLGASAHILQGMEIYRDRPIIYDSGDLLFDAVRSSLGKGGIFELEMGPSGVARVRFVPIGIGFGFSKQLYDQDAYDAVREYLRKCELLGTTLQMTQEGAAYIDLTPPKRRHGTITPAPVTRYKLDALHRLTYQTDHRPWKVGVVPDEARIEPHQFGPLTLLGIRVRPTEITRRRMLWVESFWSCDESVDEDIRLDIRGVPKHQTTMRPWGAAMDHDPCDWMVPTSRWHPGTIYRDYYGLRPPRMSEWENVDLQLTVGIISKKYPSNPVMLPPAISLAFPDKSVAQSQSPDNQPIHYRDTFPELINDCLPGETWTAEQLEAVTQGKWLVPPPKGWFVKSVVAGETHIDMLASPTLFVAHDSHDRCRHEQSRLPAKNFDRHAVIATNAGRIDGAIIRDADVVTKLPSGFPLLQVRDPIQALIELGVAARQRYSGDIIAVTGTAGKSTTIAMLQTMLGGSESALASVGNYNSRVGALAMLANLGLHHQAALIEIAQSALWMRRGPITRLVKPTVAVITEIGVSQTDRRVKSVADTAKWKSRIFDGLTGPAIAVIGEHLNCYVEVLHYAHKHAKRVVTFGRSDAACVRIESVEADGEGSWVSLVLGRDTLRLRVPSPGDGMVNNAVAAISVLYAIQYDVYAGAARLKEFLPSEGRMHKQQMKLDGRTIQLIDDSFNATVISMINAFSVLSATKNEPTGRKIAVLGRIVHLGDLAQSLHEGLAGPLMETGVQHVVTHGDEMRFLRAVLPKGLLGPHFSSARALVKYLRPMLRSGDLVLLKGSRRDSDFGNIATFLMSQVPGHVLSTRLKQRTQGPSTLTRNERLLRRLMAVRANDFSTSPHLKKKGDLARNLISEEAIQFGFSVETERGRSFRVSNVETEAIFSQNAPESSVVSSATTSNKQLTKAVLSQSGIPVPRGRVFAEKSKALAYFQLRASAQVVKPLSGAGGKGVTAGIVDEADFSAAWDTANRYARRVIVEDYIAGDEVRIIVLGGRVLAAVCRVPANVLGDGIHTIEELVAIKNRTRRSNPLLKIYPLRYFDQLALDERSLTDIPTLGEYVRLSSVSNVATGGDSVGILDKLHPSILAAAERAAKAIPGATLLGLDMLVKDFSSPADDGNICVLEINSNPAIATPVFAGYGAPASSLPSQMLEYLVSKGTKTTLQPEVCAPARIVPASAYLASCGGDSFERNYSTQMRLLRQAAHARSIDVTVLSASLTSLRRDDEHVAFFQGMSSRTRAVARRASSNKEWTKELLLRAGVRTPVGQGFTAEQREQAWHFLTTLGRPATVKPIVGSGGSGVSTEVVNREHFDKAWEYACVTGSKMILVEEHIYGNDYRIVAIGNFISAVTQRIPAHLIGDGIHTVDELINLKNTRRQKNPYSGSNPVILTSMIQHNMTREGVDVSTVLENGRRFELHTVANVGMGGDSRDVTDYVHPDWAQIAVNVRKAIYDPVHVGLDLIAEDISQSPVDQLWSVIEVNCNPDFGLQHFPTEGTPRDMAGALVEYLFPESMIEAVPCCTKRIQIMGAVQGVGYRKWLWRQAHLHAACGWVRNRADGSVEALLSGPTKVLDQLLEACRQGPTRARVSKIVIEEHDAAVKHGFCMLDTEEVA